MSHSRKESPWSEKNHIVFVHLMEEQVKKNNRTTNTFNRVGWNEIKKEMVAQTGYKI